VLRGRKKKPAVTQTTGLSESIRKRLAVTSANDERNSGSPETQDSAVQFAQRSFELLVCKSKT
jgi:hypothetical protein